ncbi:MAG: CHAT domain-containing protein/Tfp pilus assembly protein PilF [Polaribacter sp.]|jgi:CHAT domain-containing protein/Tfp pilus assembly protein PilF
MIRFLLSLIFSLHLFPAFSISQSEYQSQTPTTGENIFQEAEKLLESVRYSEALEKYEQSNSLFEKEENWLSFFKSKAGEMRCRLRLGHSETLLKMIKPTQENCISKLGNQAESLGTFYYLDAIIDQKFRDGQQTTALIEKALSVLIPAKGKEDVSVANCYNMLGNYWGGKKDYEQSLSYHNQSLAIKKAALGKTHPSVGISYNNLGILYQRQGDNAKAIDFYEKALTIKINRYGKNHPRVADTYFNVGQLHMQGDDYEKSIVFLKKSIAIDRQQEESQDHKLAHRYTSLSEAYFLINRFDLAIEYGQLAVDHYQKISLNPEYSAAAYQNLGTIHQSVKDYESALSFYQKALATLSYTPLDDNPLSNPDVETWSVSERRFQLLTEKMTTLDSWNHEAPALLKLEAALSTAEALIAIIIAIQQNIEGQQSKFLFQENTRAVFEKALSFCYQLFQQTSEEAYLEEAFIIYEQSKSVLLRSALQNERAKSLAEIPDSLRQQVSDVKILLEESALVLKETTDETKKRKLEAELFDKKESYRRLVNSLEKEFPRYYQIKNKSTDIKLSDVQKQIAKDQESILAWFTGKEHLFFFHIAEDQIVFEQIERDSQFESSIISFYKLLNDNALASGKGNARSLYLDFINQSNSIFQQLFPVDIPATNALILIPDGVLNLIPFELLLTKKVEETEEVDYASLPFLLKKASIRYAYSPSFLLNVPKPSKIKKDLLLAFAPSYENKAEQNSSREKSFSTLAFAQREVQRINDLMDAKILTGTSATENNFKEQAGQYRLLHLAMHAFTDEDSPALSGLLFSKDDSEEDATLYGYEIANLKLSAELTVLSACNTGAGKLAVGEGPISLARAFRQAGCPNILMSLWQADDEATSILMGVFYENLKAGKGKAEALQLAKLTYLEEGPMIFPHYWAAFVLTGDDEPIDFGKEKSWWFLSVGVFILLGGFGWAWNRGYFK